MANGNGITSVAITNNGTLYNNPLYFSSIFIIVPARSRH